LALRLYDLHLRLRLLHLNLRLGHRDVHIRLRHAHDDFGWWDIDRYRGSGLTH
jgi:hypothetical protein